jgi:hypothetical protein
MADAYPVDEEKRIAHDVAKLPGDSSSDEVPGYLRNASQKGFFGRLRYYEEALDRKIGVESHGIARKLPEERDPSNAKWSNQLVCLSRAWHKSTDLSCIRN